MKILHKSYGILGMKDWWVDCDVVDVGYADKAVEDKHYSHSTNFFWGTCSV